MSTYIKEGKPFIVGICGRSCSGKGALADTIASQNNKIIRICQDSYFKINTPVNTKGYWDIDDPRALMMDQLIDTINKVKKSIGVKTPSVGWTENFNVEITTKDLTARPIILIEGFLLFIYDELSALFDSKIFVDVTDLNILYRRLRRDKTIKNISYIYDIVIPNSVRDEPKQKDSCDAIVDGNLSPDEVLSSVEGYLNDYVIKTPDKLNHNQGAWKVHFGDLVSDHMWHPLDYDNLKSWAKTKESLLKMDAGKELIGHTFAYRKSKHAAGQYEIRLKDGCNIFRYEPELTTGLAIY